MNNGESAANKTLDLRDVLVIQTTDDKELEFEVVGLVEDDESNAYAVMYCEPEDEFVVTDAQGNLLQDDDLAQEILDDFFVLAEESGGDEQHDHDHNHDHDHEHEGGGGAR